MTEEAIDPTVTTDPLVAAAAKAAEQAIPVQGITLERHPAETIDPNPLVIRALDIEGPGGAHHLYEISGFNSANNPSDPYVVRYGKPADHTMILFQNGALKDVERNGITIESLLEIAKHRLDFFQRGPFACRENEAAAGFIALALSALHARKINRVERGVQGTMQV